MVDSGRTDRTHNYASLQQLIDRLVAARDPNFIDALSNDIAALLTDETIDVAVCLIIDTSKHANVDRLGTLEVILMVLTDLIQVQKRHLPKARAHLFRIREGLESFGSATVEDIQDVDMLLSISRRNGN